MQTPQCSELLVKYLVANARTGSLDVLCGVYFLFDAGEIIYIGQSRDILVRLRTHYADVAKPFDRWAYIDVPVDDLEEVERRYIRMFQPAYNKTLHEFPRRRFYRPKRTFGRPVMTKAGVRLIDDQPVDNVARREATALLDSTLRPSADAPFVHTQIPESDQD